MNSVCPTPGQGHGRLLAYKRLMRLALELGDIPRKVLALDLGVDAGTITRYLDDAYDCGIPAHQLRAYHTATGDLSLLRAIAQDHGYALTPLEGEGRRVKPGQVLPLLSRTFGAQLGHEVEHLSDGTYTAAEASEDVIGWTKVLRLVEAHLDHVKAVAGQEKAV